MKRDIGNLANKEHDLTVIGGGIFGACAAWDAVLRGLRVALIDKEDFSHATSANHFKMIHGGMRYLQHLDVKRVRESSRERSILLKTAPHLATPLPILMPTYGHGLKGKEILRTGLSLYELITFDRNKGIEDPKRQIPKATFLSRDEVLQEYPGLDGRKLTGGVVFCDGQIYNPPRLVLSYIAAAAREGLEAANYVEAVDYIRDRSGVKGVVAHDRLTGAPLEIRSKFVLNAAGPWAHRLNQKILKKPVARIPSFSRDLVIVVPKKLSDKYAFAHIAKTRDRDAMFDRGGRHLFIVPWRHYSLIGVWHQVFNKGPEEITVKSAELQGFLDEINNLYSKVQLSINDISMVNTGLILFGAAESQGGAVNHSFAKRSMVIDHFREEGLSGLLTLIGVRATVARSDAEAVLNVIQRRLGSRVSVSKTRSAPIYGGCIDNFEEYLEEAQRRSDICLEPGGMRALVHNYGSEYRQVLKFAADDASLGEEIDGSGVLRAEVVNAIREEMALKLEDVVFRRTELGTGDNPGRQAIEACADLMGRELEWDVQRKREEIGRVMDVFSRRGPWQVF